MKERYEPVEIESCWYIIDHKHPDKEPARCKDEEDANLSARIWNVIWRET